MARDEHGLSETIAQMLIAFLIIIIALFIIAALTGVLTGFLQKSAFIAVTASTYDTGAGTSIISLYHEQGDLVNLNGTSQTRGTSEIAIMLTTPTELPVPIYNATPMHAAAWGPGQQLYIYPVAGSYGYSDLPPAAGTLLPPGDYTVQIIDTKVNVLLHSLPVKIS